MARTHPVLRDGYGTTFHWESRGQTQPGHGTNRIRTGVVGRSAGGRERRWTHCLSCDSSVLHPCLSAVAGSLRS